MKYPSTQEILHQMVVDFCKIQQQLGYWSYPIMRIGRIFSKLQGTRLFSTLDIRSGYYNITIDNNSRKYAAFTTKYGISNFFYVPFGIHIGTQLLHSDDQ